MSLEESSRELVTINTHRGLYRYTRLPFGVASAPALIQQVMDTVLQGLPKVICYLDDILITGSTEEEHIQRFQQYGIRAKRAKCVFMSNSVEYLGHRIDSTGLHTTTHKVEAISQAPQPRNTQELRSFLGLLHYYGKFLPNLATLLHPLNNLLKTGQKWAWTQECLQRWALLLSAYAYDIEFKPTLQHANADGLSRLPLPTEHPTVQSVSTGSAFTMGQIQALPVTAELLQTATRQDPMLRKILQYVREGWRTQLPDEYKPYLSRKLELSTEGGCLLWGTRVVVPLKLRSRLVEELHRDHPGVTRMKAVARSYMWWPGMDKELEECAKSCQSCQGIKSAPPVAPLHPWLWPDKPWQRIHLDFAGPFLGRMFLIVVDAHSKWPEVIEMTTTTTSRTMRKIFAANGLPQQVMSDNGPQFASSEFAMFMKMNGIKHIRCAPYHPSSNGAAERFVQTFKKAMKAGEGGTVPLSQRLSSFLLTYRTMPHATTNEMPSQLFMGRNIRTILDLLKPSCHKRISDKQAQQKADHDRHARRRELQTGQQVMVRNLRPGTPWVPGVVVKKLAPLSYLVRVGDQLWKRHMDHLRGLSDTPVTEEEPQVPDADWTLPVTTEQVELSDPSDNDTERSPSSAESSAN